MVGDSLAWMDDGRFEQMRIFIFSLPPSIRLLENFVDVWNPKSCVLWNEGVSITNRLFCEFHSLTYVSKLRFGRTYLDHSVCVVVP